MNIQKEMRDLVFAIAPFLLEASRQKHSIVKIEIDTARILRLTGCPEGAGKAYVVIAGRPSIALVKGALASLQMDKP